MDVAQGREGGVEGVQPRLRQHGPGPAAASGRQDREPDEDGRHQHPASPQPRLQQPDEPDRGDQHRRQEQCRRRCERVPTRPAHRPPPGKNATQWLVPLSEDSHPVAPAVLPADSMKSRNGERRSRAGRGAPATTGTPGPPANPRPPRSRPRRARPARREGEQQHRAARGRPHQGGVLPTHQRDRGRREDEGRPSRAAAPQVEHQREHGPREHGRGQGLAAQSAHRREDPRREHVGQPGEHRARGADPRPAGSEPTGALVGEDHHRRGPQPLPDPHGHAEQLPDEERRTHREQVARRLVLQPAEGPVAVPQVDAARRGGPPG